VIVAHAVSDVSAAMAAVEEGLRRGYHAAGFVSYEAAPGFDAALTAKPPSDIPLVWFGLFERPQPPTTLAVDSANANDTAPVGATPWLPDISPGEYRNAVAAVHHAIANGDSYQANYTFRLRASTASDDTGTLYHRLAGDQHAPYAAHLDLGRWQILSLSPELFFRIDGGVITTKPMKGTASRGTSADDDAARAAWLRASEKNRAENVMIVDLARNDISRVAEVGSVRVTKLFDIERYPSVFQMVSTVQGRLRSGTTLTEVFTALFPAGSITGAPKTSSMKLIASLERDARGVYCGAIGFASPDGSATFNVAIRTATIDTISGEAQFGTGGGITWDSRADDEYAEALAKTACLTPTPGFDLFETMRLERGAYARLDGHLRRLERSAAYFARPFAEATLRDALVCHAQHHPDQLRRVRVRLDAAGTPHIDSDPFTIAPAPPQPVVLASTPVSRADRWLYHKTTRRAIYDRHRAEHPSAFDVLLWNEDGALTEFTIGNLVVEIDGHRWTPPIESGLLPGVFRAGQVDAGVIRERVLTRADLTQATRVWLINSLREWVEVTVAAPYARRHASDVT
jgi:para-aminobenzoate synthetase/4-amino-4-deoxychorismate lyase